jgi:Uma2 family endonuclease
MSGPASHHSADRLLTAAQFASLPGEDAYRVETHYDAGFWGAPDLAVEITSPSNRAPDVQEKVTDYLDAGVRLVWVVDPHTRTVTTHAPDATARILRQTDTLNGGDVLPGFRLPLAGFFAV